MAKEENEKFFFSNAKKVSILRKCAMCSGSTDVRDWNTKEKIYLVTAQLTLTSYSMLFTHLLRVNVDDMAVQTQITGK